MLTGENRITQIKTCPSAIVSTASPTWTGLGSNSGVHGERLATVSRILRFGRYFKIVQKTDLPMTVNSRSKAFEGIVLLEHE
jgi:hypothetical protein